MGLSKVPPRVIIVIPALVQAADFRSSVGGMPAKVDIVGYMVEEPFAITRFEIPKDLVNIGGGQPLCIRNSEHLALPRDGRFFTALSEFDPRY